MADETVEVKSAPDISPHSPAPMDAHAPVIEAQLGPEPEDFVVDEIALYAHSGVGEHLYVRVEKRGYTTPVMVRAVSRAAGVNERDVGYAGLKDKQAVTRQWLSLPAKARAPNEWQLPEGMRVIEHTRHGNKLRTGHLLGNRFRIGLTTTDTHALDKAQRVATFLRQSRMGNYFGGQRFGRQGDGLRQALGWLQSGARLHRMPHFLTKLYPSVLQAEVFNRYLSARRALGFGRLIAGEVVRLNGSGSLFMVEDVAREEPRFRSGDLLLTGPIFGPKMRPSGFDGQALEARMREEVGLTPRDLETLGRLAPGTRRDLLVEVAELECGWSGEGRLELAFSLPAGSYATEVIRQFTHGPFLLDRGEPAERDGGS